VPGVTHAELREQVLRANLEIVDAGLVVLMFGNVSAVDRAAGVLAIKPSGVPYDELRAEAMVLVDLASGQAIESRLRPSSDTPTHLVLYRRFEQIGGVVHTHSPYATAWSQARLAIPCLGTTHADHFGGPVPVTRALTREEVDGDYERNTGEVIVETLEGLGLDPLRMPAALVGGHGPFVWGADVAQAVENAAALEAVASLAARTLQIEPRIGELDAALLRRHFERKHGPGAYYGQDAKGIT
jgi:L-ribulose-5-phosphate 4-epimerase